MADEKQTGRRAPLGVVDVGEKKTRKPGDELSGVSPDANDSELAKATINEQIAALKEEVARMKESLGTIAESSGQYAVSQVNSLREEVRGAVTANPIGALLCAGLVGYLMGLRRR